MLDSFDARERSYDNSAKGINITIRKVNLVFVFIVVVWIFFFNKNMIQNPVFFLFFAYNVIMLSIVYALVLSQAAQAHASRKSQRLIATRGHDVTKMSRDTRFGHWLKLYQLP